MLSRYCVDINSHTTCQWYILHQRNYYIHWLIYSLHMQCSTNELCYIQDFKSDHVLDLEHEPNVSVCKSNGAAAVFNPKADPPTASQQWYLYRLFNGHYLVISKPHGKVLTYQIDEVHCKCFVSNSNGGQDQQWMKEEDSVVSVKYNSYSIGKCVDVVI